MIIGVTGYGGSGASACIALIKEFDNVQFYRDSTEFQILQQPDGITDLRYNLVESRRRIRRNCKLYDCERKTGIACRCTGYCVKRKREVY